MTKIGSGRLTVIAAGAALGLVVAGIGSTAMASTSVALRCSASASPSRPAINSSVMVHVATQPGAKVTEVAHFKSTSVTKHLTAGPKGNANTGYNSRAAYSFKVKIAVTVRKSGHTASCSSSFTTKAKPKPSGPTVTYVTTGSAPAGVIAPTIIYGPDGSDYNGTVPMDKTVKIPSNPPAYYAITVQLSDAGGSATCKLEVNGKVISTGHATGAFNIASCEISQDPVTGKWENDD